MYFIRQANENIDGFTKETFVMEIDPNTGLKYIRKEQDEQTKNHQDDTTFTSGIMPEIPDSPLCPVKSYMFYLSKLHPRCGYLWQHCKDKEDITDSDIWFKPLKIGQNPLAAFMSRVSHDADLSKVYTNHSIQVTGTTLLVRYNFSDKQIMSVSGHRSINSLSVYKKVSDQEKIAMGMAMNHYIHTGQQQIMNNINIPKPSAALGAPPKEKESEIVTPNTDKQPSTSKEIIQYKPEDPLLQEDFNQDMDFDVSEMLNEIEKNVAFSQVQSANNVSTTVQCQTKKKSSPSIPLFNNCKIGTIGNIHIHFHKH